MTKYSQNQLYGFLISQSSIFGIGLNAKKPDYCRTFSLRKPSFSKIRALLKEESKNQLVSGGLLEKDLEFKPSFGDYLKVMESVKTGRVNKKPETSKRYKSNNDSQSKDMRKKQFLEKDDKDKDKGESECSSNKAQKASTLNQHKKAKILEQNELSEKPLDILKSKEHCNSQRNQDLEAKNNIGSTDMSRKLISGHNEREKVSDRKFTVKRVKLNRTSIEHVENDDEGHLMMDRAAFKPCEVVNDIMDKPRVSRMEMEERIQKLAMSLNGADINMPEWMFSKMMRSAKVRFSDHSILRVIQILGKLGNWKRVLQVIEWLQLRERFKSHKIRFIYTAALDALGKARRPVEALNVFNVMQKQMSTYPDLVAYHCIAVSLGQAGHMKELFDVIDGMQSPKKKFKTGVLEKWDPRLEPDTVVYNAVLNACVRRKQWEGAFWVLQQLKQKGQKPSGVTYGLVMEVMFACGKYNLVHEFFKKVQKSSLPNSLTYKVLVNTLWREGRTDEAILAVQEMERRGIVGSASLYYDLARCLCSAGRCKEAVMQIDKICKVASKPLVVTYTGLIQACLDSGKIESGAYIFNQMCNSCSPNLVTYNIMLQAYVEKGMFQEAIELFQNMLTLQKNGLSSGEMQAKERVMPDIYTFNTMLEGCCAAKRWNDFEYVYKMMLSCGHRFNSKRHLRMILDAARAGKVGPVEKTWKHLNEEDQVPPPPLAKERFCIKLEEDDYHAALSCVVMDYPTTELQQAFSKKAWLNLLRENSNRFRRDTLANLTREGSVLVAQTDSPNPVIENLVTSCTDFLKPICY